VRDGKYSSASSEKGGLYFVVHLQPVGGSTPLASSINTIRDLEHHLLSRLSTVSRSAVIGRWIFYPLARLAFGAEPGDLSEDSRSWQICNEPVRICSYLSSLPPPIAFRRLVS
jgi:hypothetical protein